jgi:MFS family permease
MRFSQKSADLVAAIVTAACCDISIGLTFQLNPLLLQQLHWSATAIGLVSAMGPLGIIVSSPFFASAISKWGNTKVIGLALLLMFVSLGLFPLVTPIWWFPLRFIFGLSIGALFTAGETWIMVLTTEQNRGRIFGIYTSVLTFSFAVGPLIIPFTGINGFLPWATGMGFVALGGFVLFIVKPSEVTNIETGHGMLAVVRQQPLLFAAIGAVTFFESVYIPFFVIFGEAHGLSLNFASFLLGFGIVGCAVLYFPFGYVSDHMSRPKLLIISVVLSIVLSLLMIPSILHWSIWPITLALRLFAIGVYMVSFTVIGDIFKGRSMLNAGAAVSMLWGIGGLAAPPVAGVAIDQFGVDAMPVCLAAIFAIMLVALALNRWKLVND